MIRAKDIQDKLFGLIGWEQDFTGAITLSESLTQSESGLYFQQVHPLLTLQNLMSIAPDFKNIDASTYNERFSEWLTAKTKASIFKAVNRFYTEKLVQRTSSSIVENKVLFDGTSRIADTIKNKNNLVGFEIVPIRSKGVTVKINKIGIQVTKPGDLQVYLMHSSYGIAVETKVLSIENEGRMNWFDFSVTLGYDFARFTNVDGSEGYISVDAGGSWYLVYSQALLELDMEAEAIRKDYDWSKGPCSACSRSETILWKAWSPFLEVHPFYVNLEHTTFPEADSFLWDIEKNVYTYDTNYGLNLDISVECDLTDFIIEQRHIFTDVIAKQLAVDMLREFAFNPNARANRHSINASRVDILYELDGDSGSMKKSGLNYELEQAYKAINLSTAGLSAVCLKCRNNGLKYRTV